MNQMNRERMAQEGFTLVEMMVALMIVSWLLSSAYMAVSAFAGQRLLMQKRFLGQSVAWNELMERYRLNQDWSDEFSLTSPRESYGSQIEYGVEWYWQFEQQPALGRGVVKQTVNVYDHDISHNETANPSATLVLFQVEKHD